MSKTLVVGASGTVGAEIVKILKSKNEQVYSATSQKAQEYEQRQLNLVTQSGVETAFKDIDNLFLLSPPGHVNQDQLLVPTISKAKGSGIKKIVLMTAMGANAVDSTPLRQAEIALERSGVSYNIIRPNWFMQNFNSYWIAGINGNSRIYLPVGGARGSFIDARDIAATAAELLISSRFDNQAFDLTGSEALDHFQVAKLISKTTGRQIEYQEVSPEEMKKSLLQAGLPEPYANFLLVILDFFKQGFSERTTDSVEKITGRRPITFEQYTKDYKSAWL